MIVPDINLLIYAYDSSSPFHRPAVTWWEGCLSGDEPVGLLPVVAFGFLRITTHPRVFRNPMTAGVSAAHIESWINEPVVEWLDPGVGHFGTVLRLVGEIGTAGNLVTDAQIAAAAMHLGATVHTVDADFVRFAGLRWFNPISGTEGGRQIPSRFR
jgi:toxin-antitoxin system PIN domain toxin